MSARALLLVVACAVPLGATGARAQDDALAAMRAAYANVDYEKCRGAAARALKQPADKAGRIDAYKHLGLCEAALGDTDAARDAFRMMLTVDREAKLPDGLSPRFTSAYREAKGALVGGAPLALTVEKDTNDGGTRTLLLAVTDTNALVKNLAWRGEGGVLSPPVRAAPKLELEVPANVDVTVVALDEAKGEIATVTLTRIGAPSAEAAQVAATDAEQETDLTPVLIGAAVVAGVLVVGGAAAIIAVVVLTPPSAVTVKTGVVFQNDK